MTMTDKESALVPLELHNELTAGPAPWTSTRVPAEVFHVARAIYGSSDLEDEKRVYRTLQGALWKLTEGKALVPVEPTQGMVGAFVDASDIEGPAWSSATEEDRREVMGMWAVPWAAMLAAV